MSTDRWGEGGNAARYEAFARRYPAYEWTSRDLVRLAGLPADATVVDLACGTGATAREILSVLGPGGTVIGVDKSPAMLAVAARSVPDRRARWIEAAAEELHHQVCGPVGAVICNSAIWQTELAAAAAAVHDVLADGGRFVFNIARGFLGENDDANAPGDLVDVVRTIAAAEFGWTPPGAETNAQRRRVLTRESVRKCVAGAGFELEHVTEFGYEGSAEAQRAWLAIPVFSRNYLPGLSYEQRMHVFDQAFELLGASGVAERWVAFAARRRAASGNAG